MSIAGNVSSLRRSAVLLRLEAAAAPHRQGAGRLRALRSGNLEPLRVDDIEDDALLSELLRGPLHLVFEGLDAAVRSRAEGASHAGDRNPAADPHQVLASRDTGQMLPETLDRGQGFRQSEAACLRVGQHVGFELAARDLHRLRRHLPVGREHLDELFGLDHRLVHVDCGLERHGDERLVDAAPQRIGVVGKVVQDAQPAAHLVDRHPASRRECLEEFHRHRAHAHAVLDWRVQLVQQQRRDVARRSRREFHAVGEKAGGERQGVRLG